MFSRDIWSKYWIVSTSGMHYMCSRKIFNSRIDILLELWSRNMGNCRIRNIIRIMYYRCMYTRLLL